MTKKPAAAASPKKPEEGLLSLPELAAYQLLRTYNPERDLEPHPTIKLTPKTGGEVDYQHLAKHVFNAVSPHLPPPGYVDIVFENV